MTTLTRTAIVLSTLAATLLGVAAAAGAQTASPTAPASAAASAALTEGEVKKIDHEAGKLTLRHGPIVNLDMPAMTMVFRVADSKMLDALQVGDKVRFHVEKVNGAYTVTSIAVVKP